MNKNLMGFLIGAGIGTLLLGNLSSSYKERMQDVYFVKMPSARIEVQNAIYFPQKETSLEDSVKRTREVFY